MDKFCFITLDTMNTGSMGLETNQYIRKNCERNNILLIRGLMEDYVANVKALLCRYDRNVHVDKFSDDSPYGGALVTLSCVLYDNEMREIVKPALN